jgi:hypothetical protein
LFVAGNMGGAKPRQAWSWKRWAAYFRRNAETLLPIAWQLGMELTEKERQTLLPSLQEFQQGEGQEGGHFFRCVRRYAEQTGEGDYVEAHRLFMAEEKRHAADLARVLHLAGVPLLSRPSLLTRLFCWFGSLGQLELTLTIILMSEVCGQTYYGFLRKAAGSHVLQQLCSQILHDEMFHVRFQCEALARLRQRRGGWLLGWTHALDGLLFLGAGLLCWWGHRRVLRRAGATFTSFWHQARLHLFRASMLKDPATYAWGQEQEATRTEHQPKGRPVLLGK